MPLPSDLRPTMSAVQAFADYHDVIAIAIAHRDDKPYVMMSTNTPKAFLTPAGVSNAMAQLHVVAEQIGVADLRSKGKSEAEAKQGFATWTDYLRGSMNTRGVWLVDPKTGEAEGREGIR